MDRTLNEICDGFIKKPKACEDLKPPIFEIFLKKPKGIMFYIKIAWFSCIVGTLLLGVFYVCYKVMLRKEMSQRLEEKENEVNKTLGIYYDDGKGYQPPEDEGTIGDLA